jgi:hypothetical protein
MNPLTVSRILWIFHCALIYVQIPTSSFEFNKQMKQLTINLISGENCICIYIYIYTVILYIRVYINVRFSAHHAVWPQLKCNMCDILHLIDLCDKKCTNTKRYSVDRTLSIAWLVSISIWKMSSLTRSSDKEDIFVYYWHKRIQKKKKNNWVHFYLFWNILSK